MPTKLVLPQSLLLNKHNLSFQAFSRAFYTLLSCFVGLFLSLVSSVSIAVDIAAEAPVYQVELLSTFPHDENAFTQGLIAVDGQLYEGTGRKGQSSLRLVELETGELLKRRNLSSRYFGEGITLMDGKIYQLTWQAHLVFVYEQDSFDLLDSFYLSGEGWGITHNGSELIVSDGTSFLRFLDPETQKEIRRVQVTDTNGPVGRLNELEYINGEVWANVWYADYLVRIDPQTGRIKSRVDLRGLSSETRPRDNVLNGIAWDEQSQRLFVTGKLWPNVYEIRVLE